MSVTGPDELPAKSPPEIPTAPPFHKPGTLPEAPRRPNSVPDFDAILPEKPADLPPISPGPNPEFPGPGNPSPPGQPEVVPPHGPGVIPPKPTEPGEGVPQPKPEIELPNGPDFVPSQPPGPEFPHPTQPDIPPPIIM
ncbi:hypothetical protein ACH5RR_033162 [Cinchona calisaya]|uniref:Uncharacterized protein n=1 Tax=Cinchona calisaya TaxID=153742 RepID=A0ABD2YNP5_9GENT